MPSTQSRPTPARPGRIFSALAALAVLTAPAFAAHHGVLDYPADEAATSTIVPLWPGDDLAAVTREILVFDDPVDPNSQIRGVLRPSLTIYRPVRGTGNGIAILAIPGGAYRRLYLTAGGYDFANFLTARGYTVGLLKYRMAEPALTGRTVPLPIRDGLRAVRLLRSKAREFGFDPRRLGVVGTSAGGHVAASCAAFGDDGRPFASDPVERFSSRPDFLILHSPVVSMEPGATGDWIITGLLGRHPDPAMAERYSIERHVGPKWPPTLIVSARDDSLTAGNSLPLIEAIRRAGRPVDSLIYATGGHAFALKNLTPPRDEWPKKWLDWIRARTAD